MKKVCQIMMRFVVIMVIVSAVSAENSSSPVFGGTSGQEAYSTDEKPAENPLDETGNEPEDETGKEPEDETKKEPELKKPVLQTASRPDGKIKISWKKTAHAAEYVLFRSSKKDSGFRRIYKTKKNYSYMDQCTAGKTYYYQLAVFTKGRTKRADSKKIKGYSLKQAELTQISNLSASRKLVLHWKAVKGAAGYRIKRKSGNGSYKTAAVVKGNKTYYTDTKLSGGKIYTYKVCALDADGGWGNYSRSAGQMAVDAKKKMIALTYDDGPSPYTNMVLDALEKYEAHATFFVVGNQVNSFAKSIRRETALGCEIGNHTYGHNMLNRLSISQVQSVLGETNRAVKRQAGVDIRVMRPPGGSYSPAVCAAAGMPVILWSIDTLDWKTRSTAATIKCIRQKACDGAVVLMHDLHKPTAEAADTVIRYLKNAGYQMVTVSEMAAYRGGMKAGKVYSWFPVKK